MKHKIISTLMLTALVSVAQADDRPAVIESLEQQGIRHLQEFEIDGDLRAFAGTSGQAPITIYVLEDGDAIVGQRIDPRAQLLDEDKVKELVAGPMSQAIWDQLEESTWVADGQDGAPRVVYTFTDPNCPYCHGFWEAARPWVEAGKVQLRHVMVGIIRADSSSKAQSILEADNPGQAMTQNELAFDQGGIQPAEKVSQKIDAQLRSNHKLMLELGFRGTPGILYPGADGSVQTLAGMPQGNALEQVLGPL